MSPLWWVLEDGSAGWRQGGRFLPYQPGSFVWLLDEFAAQGFVDGGLPAFAGSSEGFEYIG